MDAGAVACALADMSLMAGVAAAGGAAGSVRDVLRADFLASPRAAPEAVAGVLRALM